MSNEKGQNAGKRRLRWIGAAIVISGAVAGGVIGALNRPDGGKPAVIMVAAADRGAVTLDVATTGTVEPATTRSLTFAVSGTVASVLVRPGNRVGKGQKLATLDATDATASLAAARTALTEARDRLATARTVAARVTASATTCARTARPIAPAAVQPQLAEPQLAEPQLAEPMAVPPAGGPGPMAVPPAAVLERVAPAPAPAIGGRAAAPCRTRGYPDTGNDPMLTTEQQVNRAEHAVEVAQQALDGTTVTAPIAGTVVAVEGKVGDQIRAGTTFVSLADTYTMQVRAAVPEADAGALAAGQTATVSLADSDAVYAAQVAQVDPAGTSDGTLVRYGVLLSFADSPADLLVGQSAEVRVRTGEVTDALRVPSTAVHDVSGGSGTVLVRVANRSEERVVSVGLRGDRYTEITAGLAQGDQVVRSW